VPDPATQVESVAHTLAIANLITSWVALINIPLLLLIVRMLWGFNNRLTTLEVQARTDGSKAPARRYYRKQGTEK